MLIESAIARCTPCDATSQGARIAPPRIARPCTRLPSDSSSFLLARPARPKEWVVVVGDSGAPSCPYRVRAPLYSALPL